MFTAHEVVTGYRMPTTVISWLTQSHTEISEPARARVGCGYLNEEEYEQLLTLKTAKRRDDWLLGRWTAKRLLQTVIWEKDGRALPIDAITITNDVDGVPSARLPEAQRLNYQYSISISHTHGRAFVAALEKPNALLGADMERIQERSTGFAEEYFTTAEIALGHDLRGPERAVWETAVWSAKEAVLKAYHLGLSVSTRSVSCLIEPVDHLPKMWLPFAIQCDYDRLPQPAPPLTGWWRVEDGFVLTIAVG